MIGNLLRIARDDLAGARTLGAHRNRNAIYLCEQAAEKVIRAVLTSERIHAGVRHRLDEMVSLVPDENPLKPELRELQHLAIYATAYRYTTPTGRIPDEPSAQVVAENVKKVDAALTEAARRFGVDLGVADKPASSAAPIR
ncbi:MAG TPA: HEPN domain-containing protein [Kofleriaceae bacterium]|nr:HEPN domain-containing protein [Kofleriaceae bacterium]